MVFRDSKGHDREIYIESLFSKTTFNHETVIAKKSRDPENPVVALSGKLLSVMSTNLNEGWGFVVVDETGKSLYHVDKTKVLKENFFDEIDKRNIISGTRFGRNEAHFDFNYLDERYVGYISPINNLPFFIITYYDKNYSLGQIQGIISLSILFICFTFIFVSATYFTLNLFGTKSSKLKRKQYFFNWLKPIQNKGIYLKLSIYLFILLLLEIGLSVVNPISDAPWGFLEIALTSSITSSTILVLSYVFINRTDPKKIINLKEIEANNEGNIHSNQADLEINETVVIPENIETEEKEESIAKKKKGYWEKWLALVDPNKLKSSYLFQITLVFIGYTPFYTIYFNIDGYQISVLYYHLIITYLAAIMFMIFEATRLNTNADIDQKIDKTEVKKRTFQFQLFLVLWLAVGAIVPTFQYFNYATSVEHELWTKHSQLDMAMRLEKRFKSFAQDTTKLKTEAKSAWEKLPDSLGIYLTSGAKYEESAFELTNPSHPDSLKYEVRDYVINYLRPVYSQLFAETQQLSFHESLDGTHEWNHREKVLFKHKKDSIKLYHKNNDKSSIIDLRNDLINLEETKNDNIALKDSISLVYSLGGQPEGEKKRALYLSNKKYSFRLLNFTKDEDEDWIVDVLTVVILILIGLAVYKLLGYSIQRIFALDFFDYNPFSNKARKYLDAREKLFIVGSRSSGSTDEGQTIFDMRLLCGPSKSTADIHELVDQPLSEEVEIRHFDYRYQDTNANEIRITLLEHLLALGNMKRIKVFTATHPSLIANHFKHEFGRDDLDDNSRFLFKNLLERWTRAFSMFVQVHEPLDRNKELAGELFDQLKADSPLREVLTNELQIGEFLPTLTDAVIENHVDRDGNEIKEHRDVDTEEVIITIQLLSEGYYFGIWHSLTSHEQHIIYDLAMDGFVNCNNYNGLRNLFERQLIFFDNGELCLMNQSFGNFVISIIDPEEEIRMQREVREKGSWNSISTILVIVLIAVLVFIVVGNPDITDELGAVLSVVAAALGLLPRLLPMLNLGGGNTPIPDE